ncbi:hypothetical protein GVAV_000416 [Gurleya vavrai]
MLDKKIENDVNNIIYDKKDLKNKISFESNDAINNFQFQTQSTTNIEIETRNIENTEENEKVENITAEIKIVNCVPLIKFTKLTKRLYFPSHIKKLSEIYSALLTVQRFNEQKNLKCIYIKSKNSIEKMIKDKLYIKYIEQINFLFPDTKFKKIEIEHENKIIETFTYELIEKDCDVVFWKYIWSCYLIFLEKKNFNHYGNKFVDGFNIEKIEEVPRKKLFEKVQVNTNLDFKKKIFEEDQIINTNLEKNTNRIDQKNISVKEKTNLILERIKEKEKRRKEEFIKNCLQNDDIKKIKEKIDYLFLIEEKNYIKIEKISKSLILFKAKENIDIICKKYSESKIKFLNGEEFLLKNDCK